MHSLLRHYSLLIKFLGEALGKNCEIVLHDTDNHPESIIAIVNGHVTGRKVGAPITQLALEWITDEVYKKVDFVGPYAAKTESSNPLCSSGWFIKDDSGKLVGMVCINVDITHQMQVSKSLSLLMDDINLPFKEMNNGNGTQSPEEFHSNIKEFTGAVIKRALENSSVSPERMNPDEKIEILRELNKDGVFQLKGSVSIVADHLATSEPTIYRYLKKLSIS
ncbi:MAG: putative transcriptional regulator YheO [Desulforhopalus sp.]|jgi:predicted transcriptional regulator YheO